MGIRSEVVVAMKLDVYNKLTPDTVKWLNEVSDQQNMRSEGDGVSFLFDYIKWYTCSYPPIMQLYKELSDLECDEDYLIIDACSEYPENDENDRGCWYENPWNYHKSVSVTIESY